MRYHVGPCAVETPALILGEGGFKSAVHHFGGHFHALVSRRECWLIEVSPINLKHLADLPGACVPCKVLGLVSRGFQGSVSF